MKLEVPIMLNPSETVFVLGAKDPEMDAIEAILDSFGARYVHANTNKQKRERVNHTNAYSAFIYDGDSEILHDKRVQSFVHIECEVRHFGNINPPQVVVIDHHRVGDPGFDAPPEKYWEGSSIGQLCEFMVRRLLVGHARSFFDTPQHRLIAAIDHARFWAVRGECPGVSAEDAKRESRLQIARSFHVSAFAVNALAEAYYRVLANAPSVTIAGRTIKDLRGLEDLGSGYSLEFLVLQEAAMLLGTPYLSLQLWPSGQRNVFLNRVDEPALVEAFMKEWAPTQGLVDIFGVPLRGYAGGTLLQS